MRPTAKFLSHFSAKKKTDYKSNIKKSNNKSKFLQLIVRHKNSILTLNLRYSILSALAIACIAIFVWSLTTTLLWFDSQRQANTFENDLKEVGSILAKIENRLLNQTDDVNQNLLQDFNNIKLLAKNELHDDYSILSRSKMLDLIGNLQDSINTSKKEKRRLEENITMLSSEVEGLKKSNDEMYEEKHHLLSRIDSIESNLKFEQTKNKNLDNSLKNIVAGIANVVGTENYINAESTILAKTMSKKLQRIFTSQQNLIETITNNTLSIFDEAKSIITQAGFDPDYIIQDESLGLGGPENAMPKQLKAKEEKLDNLKEINKANSPFLENNKDNKLQKTLAYGGGQGGPFLELDNGQPSYASSSSAADIFETKLNELWSQYDDANKAWNFVKCLPSKKPLEKFRVSSYYGPRVDPFSQRKAMHAGLDLAAPYYTKVKATNSGRVIKAGALGAFGRVVFIDHGCNLVSVYSHLNDYSVAVGDYVSIGDVIGSVGSTGRSTGPHLHYEIRFKRKPFNPLPTFTSQK